MKKLKTILLLLLVGVAMILISCDKEKEKPLPSPTPTVVADWMHDAGYQPLVQSKLKAKPVWWTNNGIQIIWNDQNPLYVGNGTSPGGPITLNNYESMQLSYVFLDGNTWQEGYQIAWYTNDQQIANVNWVGLLTAQWIGAWWGPTYPNTTVIYLYCYRPNPNYNGHNQRWLDPYVDNIVVSVID